MYDPGQPLNLLIGVELSSIEFVRDYLQLRFDGPYITVLTEPLIIVEHKEYSRRDEGFCNELLRFIGVPVEKTLLREGQTISLHFPSGRSIIISLRPEDLKGRSAEAVNFNDGAGGLWVW